MNNYEELIKFRNRLNEPDGILFEEDIILLDNVLNELEYKTNAYQNLKKKTQKLQEQLKNAIVPKYKIGQVVYEIVNHSRILPFEITEIETKTFAKGVVYIKYFSYKSGAVVSEDELFATEAEAQKYLEERK